MCQQNLAGSDLHENKVNATTGTELTPASQATYDLRWALRSQLLNTTVPLVGGGDLSANRTISLPVATGSQHGYLSSTDWTSFNNRSFKVEKVLGLSASADYQTSGTNDQTVFSNAFSALKSAGGGELVLLPGTYNFTDRAYSDFSNVSIRALIPGSVTIKIQWSPAASAGSFGAFTFYSDTATPIRNIRIKDIIFDHNGYKTAGVVVRGNTSSSSVSENIVMEGCEFLNRSGDARGALGSVLLVADYTGTMGRLRNVKMKDCIFHDNTANVSTYPY